MGRISRNGAAKRRTETVVADDGQDVNDGEDTESDDGATDAGGSGGGAGGDQDGANRGNGGERGNAHDGRRKPQFSEDQNRWIGRMQATADQRRRAVESERDAAKTERDALKTERETLQRDLRLSRAENAVFAAATKAGALHPDLIFRAVRDDLQFGDDGKPKDIETIVAKYKTDYPALFGARQSSGADGGRGGGGGKDDAQDMNAIIRRSANTLRGRFAVEG